MFEIIANIKFNLKVLNVSFCFMPIFKSIKLEEIEKYIGGYHDEYYNIYKYEGRCRKDNSCC